jgi:hypothetical protein
MPIRFVRVDRRIYDFSLCKLCGTAGGCTSSGCSTVTCLWCGTPQCSANGLARGQCGVCHHGFLTGWSTSAGKPCSYKGCGLPAVGIFPRKGQCCATHGARNLKPGYLDECLADRDKRWQPVEVNL